VTKWENGENEPSLQTISLITKVLQVEAAYLIDGEESAERVTAPQKKAVHSFTWGSFLKTSALFFAFAAFLLLLLPGVSGLANVMAYCLIFGLEGFPFAQPHRFGGLDYPFDGLFVLLCLFLRFAE
jgi:transcriptional regulator with XRE-family HTH domain